MLRVTPRPSVDSICFWRERAIKMGGKPHAANMNSLPALHWNKSAMPGTLITFTASTRKLRDQGGDGNVSRPPYHCTFCAKDNFRDSFRRRPLELIAEELDGLLYNGVEYVYFIDEIFLAFVRCWR